ncbi:MAG: thermonuclease family protein [Rhodothalassiaceae bacterium]
MVALLCVLLGLTLPPGLTPGPEIRVEAVTGPAQLRLVDGRVLVLAELHGFAPDERTEPALDWARQQLAALIGSDPVATAVDDAFQDRYGRLRAHLMTADGRWVQEVLLLQGAALLHPWDPPAAVLSRLRSAEAEARGARTGLWARRLSPYLAEAVPYQARGRFVIVRGRVHSVGRARRGTFVNFSDDYDSDFTVFVPSGQTRAFGGRRSFEAMIGQAVEARGVLHWWNGPFMRLDRPSLLNVPADAAAGPP